MRKHRFSVGIALTGILLLTFPVSASVDKLNISQIVEKDGDLILYASALDSGGKPSGDEISPEQFSVILNGDQTLPVTEAASFDSLGEGVSYTFCVDVSTAVTDQEMQEIRSGLTDFAEGMGEGDYGSVVTFGTEVSTLCESTTDRDALNSAISGIATDGDSADFYGGISHALEEYEKNKDSLPERAALVVITHGTDGDDSGEEQVLSDMEEIRIPIYVAGIKGNDASAGFNSAGQIARQSGGSLYSYSQMSVSSALRNIQSIMENTYCLHVSPGDESSGGVWSVTYSSEGYSVTSAGYEYPSITDLPAVEETPSPTPVEEKEGETLQGNGIILPALVVLIAVTAVVIFVLSRKKKEKKPDTPPVAPSDMPSTFMETEEDTSTDSLEEDDDTLSDDEETIEEIPERQIRLSFEITFDGETETLEKVLQNELILGRGSDCDVDVVLGSVKEERKLTSRKHAVIFEQPDGLYVRDCSRNKTFLNGEEVRDEAFLRDGDVLTLGKAQVKVTRRVIRR